MNFGDIGLVNTGLPLAGLAGLAVALPFATVPRRTRSQARLAGGMLAALALMLAAASALMAGLWVLAGNAPGPALAADPGGTVLGFLARGLASALVWLPVLGLVWLARAQAVERRRGEDMARAGARTPGAGRMLAVDGEPE